MTEVELTEYQASLAAAAPLGVLGMPGMEGFLGVPNSEDTDGAMLLSLKSDPEGRDLATTPTSNRSDTPRSDSYKNEVKLEKGDELDMDGDLDGSESLDGSRDQQFFEDYINSQAVAEDSYNDPNRKYKCHRCKVAFTRQSYLTAHNKTLMHRRGDKLNYPMEKYLDPNRPYKCETCKESFTQKNILLVHFNSVSHLHKLKQAAQQQHGEPPSPGASRDGHHSPAVSSGSTTPTPSKKEDDHKPFKCNICRVAYSQGSTLDIHMRSVLHQTRASKLQELVLNGQVDPNQPLIEQPDMNKAQQQQQKVLAEMLKNHAPLMSPIAQPPVLFGSLPPLPLTPPQSVLSGGSMQPPTNPPTPIPQPSPKPQTPTPSKSSSDTPQSTVQSEKYNSHLQLSSFACSRCNSIFVSQESLVQHQHMYCFSAPRYLPKYKPHVHRSLLENIGFECVMQFNEFNQRSNKRDKVEESKENGGGETNGGTGEERKEEKIDIDNPGSNPGSNCSDKDKTEENNSNKKGDGDGEEDSRGNDEDEVENVMPEMNKCRCVTCKKDFSSIWVLKSHQEEIHKDVVPIDKVVEFSEKFREDYDKKQPAVPLTPVEILAPVQPQTPTPSEKSQVATPTAADVKVEAKMQVDMLQQQLEGLPPGLAMDLATLQTSQMMQMPLFNMMPMPMPMNMPMAMNLHPPLMPMMMPMGPEGMANMFNMSVMDPTFMMSQKQQHHQQQQQQQQAAAAAAAAQNKRARTRISDEQLKILRAYFDINNSPTEEQINQMADKSGLPQKVIKHWFRNTLFKERQRNKDSPYNFNNPPSTTLNLEEYEKTGKISLNNNNEKEAEDVSKNQAKTLEEKHLSGMMAMQKAMAERRSLQEHDTQDVESVASGTSISDSVTPSASAPSTPAPVAPSATHTELVSALNSGTFPHLDYKQPMSVSVSTPMTVPGPTTPVTLSTPGSTPNTSPQTTPTNTASSCSSASKRANRTRFTDYQIKVLQEFFEQNAYPKDDDLDHMSKLLNLSPRVIVVWFQNARQKARKNYENQPPLDMTEDGNRYQRTPGLNYQCKKCLTVFQRYYELIRHQKTHCYKDSRVSEDSTSSSVVSPQNSQDGSKMLKVVESEQKSPAPPPAPTPPVPKTPTREPPISSSPSPAASSSSSIKRGESSSEKSSKSGIEYKCEKCNLVFSRFDLWREHQNVHLMNPNLFPNFPADSAFAMLQSVAQQQQHQQQLDQLAQQPLPLPPPPPPPQPQHQHLQQELCVEDLQGGINRKTDEEMDQLRGDEQPRDKRLRTTILPEQLDYLYQKYQVDCNPSRKQLEAIATEVGLKKRVVQVWFQNTRARERKGQYRAHQQLIHKRCPFCRALFRARSALESHLATKHPEEMAKGDISVDAIPDALEGLNTPPPITPPTTSPGANLDMSKLMSNPFNMPSPFMPFMPPANMTMNSSSNPVQMNMKRLYEDSLKKYLDELSGASHKLVVEPSIPPPPVNIPKHRSSHPKVAIKEEQDDAPLDLSKPVRVHIDLGKLTDGPITDISERSGNSDPSDYKLNNEDLLRRYSLEESFSETHSESTENDQMIEDCSNPPSPNMSIASTGSTPGSHANSLACNKRYRTQMTNLQVKVMKNLFGDYKTPTMGECEMLGKEIGLPKRVVQVWFQNARAKEKKSKLAYQKTFGTDVDFNRPPEECKRCNFKYTHKYTIQDHIFTKKHIENCRKYLSSQQDSQQEYIDPTTMSQLMRQREIERATNSWTPGSEPDNLAGHPHLAQLHAMGLQAMAMPGPMAGEAVQDLPLALFDLTQGNYDYQHIQPTHPPTKQAARLLLYAFICDRKIHTYEALNPGKNEPSKARKYEKKIVTL